MITRPRRIVTANAAVLVEATALRGNCIGSLTRGFDGILDFIACSWL
jgi:hypothetical protein